MRVWYHGHERRRTRRPGARVGAQGRVLGAGRRGLRVQAHDARCAADPVLQPATVLRRRPHQRRLRRSRVRRLRPRVGLAQPGWQPVRARTGHRPVRPGRVAWRAHPRRRGRHRAGRPRRRRREGHPLVVHPQRDRGQLLLPAADARPEAGAAAPHPQRTGRRDRARVDHLGGRGPAIGSSSGGTTRQAIPGSWTSTGTSARRSTTARSRSRASGRRSPRSTSTAWGSPSTTSPMGPRSSPATATRSTGRPTSSAASAPRRPGPARASAQLVAEVRQYYDGGSGRDSHLPFGQVAQGNLQRRERLVAFESDVTAMFGPGFLGRIGAGAGNAPGHLLRADAADGRRALFAIELRRRFQRAGGRIRHGIVTGHFGPRGFETAIAYDDEGWAPALVTNALGHRTRVRRHSYAFGQPERIESAGGVVSRNDLDPLGRIVATWADDAAGAEPDVSWTYDFDVERAGAGTHTPAMVEQRQLIDRTEPQARHVRTRTFLDGFGRELQRRQTGEAGWIVHARGYGAQASMDREWLPYLDAGEDYAAPDGARPVSTLPPRRARAAGGDGVAGRQRGARDARAVGGHRARPRGHRPRVPAPRHPAPRGERRGGTDDARRGPHRLCPGVGGRRRPSRSCATTHSADSSSVATPAAWSRPRRGRPTGASSGASTPTPASGGRSTTRPATASTRLRGARRAARRVDHAR